MQSISSDLKSLPARRFQSQIQRHSLTLASCRCSASSSGRSSPDHRHHQQHHHHLLRMILITTTITILMYHLWWQRFWSSNRMNTVSIRGVPVNRVAQIKLGMQEVDRHLSEKYNLTRLQVTGCTLSRTQVTAFYSFGGS